MYTHISNRSSIIIALSWPYHCSIKASLITTNETKVKPTNLIDIWGTNINSRRVNFKIDR